MRVNGACPAASLRAVATLAQLVQALDELYPPATAADWDAVGPVVGDPAGEVGEVLLAVDPAEAVVDEALDLGVDLLLVHHPLYLRGTSSVYGGTPKGRLVQRLVQGGCALVVAHTNADVAVGGVNDALAAALGLVDVEPLVPLAAGSAAGSGRVGQLGAARSLREFAAQVAAALPRTAAGVRTAGDPDRRVQRVAVCGGAGDSYLGEATRSGADAYVTADLRHHYATEHLAAGGPALVDPGHWASEWPWLPVAAKALADAVQAKTGDTVSVQVSELVTDPWTLHDAS
jgi:dinuclear metal center YbgI/SA1388 family protein